MDFESSLSVEDEDEDESDGEDEVEVEDFEGELDSDDDDESEELGEESRSEELELASSMCKSSRLLLSLGFLLWFLLDFITTDSRPKVTTLRYLVNRAFW